MPWAIAFLLTVAVEAPLLLVAVRRMAQPNRDPGRWAPVPAGPTPTLAAHECAVTTRPECPPPLLVFAVALAANLVTHPVLWFVLVPVLTPLIGWTAAVGLAEAAAVAVEASVFAAFLDLDRPEALAVSMLVNATSVLCGLAVVALAR